jgi:hypothetical protein
MFKRMAGTPLFSTEIISLKGQKYCLDDKQSTFPSNDSGQSQIQLSPSALSSPTTSGGQSLKHHRSFQVY